jgi:Tol biopolymer transport system component
VCELTNTLVLYNRQSDEFQDVVEETGSLTSPVWSPDSSHIAFVQSFGAKSKLLAYELNTQRVTTIVDWNSELFFPTWSSNSERVALVGETDAGYEIYIASADGSRLTQLTTTGGRAFAPSWSPDGNTLAYVKLRYPDSNALLAGGSLHLMDLTSQESQPITLTNWTFSRPVWSPDGQWITSGGVTGASIIHRTGLTHTVVVSGTAYFSPRRWSHTGGMLLFGASCCGLRDMHIVSLSDLGHPYSPFESRLNDILFWQVDATWAPDVDLIAFSGLLDAPIP